MKDPRTGSLRRVSTQVSYSLLGATKISRTHTGTALSPRVARRVWHRGAASFLLFFAYLLTCLLALTYFHTYLEQALWLELRRLPQILLVLVRRTIN